MIKNVNLNVICTKLDKNTGKNTFKNLKFGLLRF